MFAAQGILLALLARQHDRARAARGRRDARLGGGAAHLPGRDRVRDRQSPGRMGNRHPSIAPYDTFDTADGEWCSPSATTSSGSGSARSSGSQALAADARFATNAGSRRALRHAASRCWRRCWRSARARSGRALLVAAGVPCGPVRSVARSARRSAAAAREMLVRVDARDGRRHDGARRADQAVGHARLCSNRSANPGPAHRRPCSRSSGWTWARGG